MTRILKQPADVLSSMRLPVHSLDGVPARIATAAVEGDGVQGSHAADISTAVRSAVRAEVEALRDNAVREGREQGHAAAQKELRAAFGAEIQRTRRVLDTMEVALQEKLALIEPLAVRIAFEAVSVLMGEAYARGDGVTQAVRSLLAASAGTTRLRVQVPPQQLEQVRAALTSSVEDVPRALSFEADPTLAQSCRIVSEHGQLETGLDVQLRAVLDALLRAAQATDGPRKSEATR